MGPGRMQGEENKEMVPVAIKAGSSVLYSKYSGVELEGDDGTAYIVVREGDILAVLS